MKSSTSQICSWLLLLLECWKAIALESLCPLKIIWLWQQGETAASVVKVLRKDGISTTIARSLNGSSRRLKKVGYKIGANQGSAQVLRSRSQSTPTRWWKTMKSVLPNFYWLIAKRFSMQITVGPIQRFLRMTLHWVTVRARKVFSINKIVLHTQFVWYISHFAQTIHPLGQNFIVSPIVQYSRAKVACETSSMWHSFFFKETDLARSNNDQLSIIAVCMHVYTNTHMWIGCITCNHHSKYLHTYVRIYIIMRIQYPPTITLTDNIIRNMLLLCGRSPLWGWGDGHHLLFL